MENRYPLKMRSKEEILEYNRVYRLNNKDYFKDKHEEYNILNKESIAERRREYYLGNKKKANKQSVKRINERKKEDELFKLSCNIRGLINSTIKLKGYKKNSKTSEILGCTFNEFKLYLESKFESWMNWNNYGNWNGQSTKLNESWDIDHIIPISTACSEEKIIKLNHYTNLQPLCSYTNRHIKAAKIELK